MLLPQPAYWFERLSDELLERLSRRGDLLRESRHRIEPNVADQFSPGIVRR
jgi:hypothetical protein